MRPYSYSIRMAIIILIATIPAWPSRAGGSLPPLQPFNMTGMYTVSWSGIPIGSLVLQASEDTGTYRLGAYVKTKGLAYTFTRHESTTTVEGVRKGDEYLPRKFETVFKLRKKTRHIILNYSPPGILAEEYNTPPEDPNKRLPVPAEMKAQVMDALTPLFAQRPQIYKALQNGHSTFTLRAYDGRRLTDMHYNVLGRMSVLWKNQQTNAIVFKLSRTPIAGYKESELDDIRENADPEISLYLSDDGRLIPLKIVIEGSGGSFYANYASECESLEACLKRLK